MKRVANGEPNKAMTWAGSLPAFFMPSGGKVAPRKRWKEICG